MLYLETAKRKIKKVPGLIGKGVATVFDIGDAAIRENHEYWVAGALMGLAFVIGQNDRQIYEKLIEIENKLD